MIKLINFKRKGLFLGITWGLTAYYFYQSPNLFIRIILGFPALISIRLYEISPLLSPGIFGTLFGAVTGLFLGTLVNNISYEIIISRDQK